MWFAIILGGAMAAHYSNIHSYLELHYNTTDPTPYNLVFTRSTSLDVMYPTIKMKLDRRFCSRPDESTNELLSVFFSQL
jgi:hypothetical protein